MQIWNNSPTHSRGTPLYWQHPSTHSLATTFRNSFTTNYTQSTCTSYTGVASGPIIFTFCIVKCKLHKLLGCSVRFGTPLVTCIAQQAIQPLLHRCNCQLWVTWLDPPNSPVVVWVPSWVIWVDKRFNQPLVKYIFHDDWPWIVLQGL